MTLSSGQSWQGVVSGISGDTPLIVRAEVIRGLRCAEGAAEDGACIFGLKLFGSTAPSGVPTEQIDEKQHSAGRPYELIVSSCTLRGNLRGTPPRASYHVSLLGWDGASDLTLSTFEADAPLLRPYCVPAGSAAPSPRHSHGAALVSSRHARGDLMLMFGGSLQHGQPPSEGAGDGLVLSAARPSAELWALHVPSRTWRLLGPDVLPPQPLRPVAGADSNWSAAPPRAALPTDLAAGMWPAPREAHTLTATGSGLALLFGGLSRADERSPGSAPTQNLNDLWEISLGRPSSRPLAASATAERAGDATGSGRGGGPADGTAGAAEAPSPVWRRLFPPRARRHRAGHSFFRGGGSCLGASSPRARRHRLAGTTPWLRCHYPPTTRRWGAVAAHPARRSSSSPVISGHLGESRVISGKLTCRGAPPRRRAERDRRRRLPWRRARGRRRRRRHRAPRRLAAVAAAFRRWHRAVGAARCPRR